MVIPENSRLFITLLSGAGKVMQNSHVKTEHNLQVQVSQVAIKVHWPGKLIRGQLGILSFPDPAKHLFEGPYTVPSPFH